MLHLASFLVLTTILFVNVLQSVTILIFTLLCIILELSFHLRSKCLALQKESPCIHSVILFFSTTFSVELRTSLKILILFIFSLLTIASLESVLGPMNLAVLLLSNMAAQRPSDLVQPQHRRCVGSCLKQNSQIVFRTSKQQSESAPIFTTLSHEKQQWVS